MARVLVTGSTIGLGRAAAAELLGAGHHVVVHARSRDRLSDVRDLVDRGADVVVGDLSDLDQTRDLVDQVNQLGRMHAVIHNAGVISGPVILPVNVVAPYLLTATIDGPTVWSTCPAACTAAAIPTSTASTGPVRNRPAPTPTASCGSPRWPRPSFGSAPTCAATRSIPAGSPPVWADPPHPTPCSKAIEPRSGWPPADPDAMTTGGYWHHHRRVDPHHAVHDQAFQERLLTDLARHTGNDLT